jgi:hypothetical protein
MAIDLYAELQALATAFDNQNVPYAVCGGLAVALHGAPRFTKDIDILVPAERLDEAKQIVRACGFAIAALPMRFKGSGVEVHRLSRITEGMLLTVDLLVVNENLAPALDDRRRMKLDGGSLWVVSREGLVSMKLAAGRPIDLDDVEKLGGA